MNPSSERREMNQPVTGDLDPLENVFHPIVFAPFQFGMKATQQ